MARASAREGGGKEEWDPREPCSASADSPPHSGAGTPSPISIRLGHEGPGDYPASQKRPVYVQDIRAAAHPHRIFALSYSSILYKVPTPPSPVLVRIHVRHVCGNRDILFLQRLRIRRAFSLALSCRYCHGLVSGGKTACAPGNLQARYAWPVPYGMCCCRGVGVPARNRESYPFSPGHPIARALKNSRCVRTISVSTPTSPQIRINLDTNPGSTLACAPERCPACAFSRDDALRSGAPKPARATFVSPTHHLGGHPSHHTSPYGADRLQCRRGRRTHRLSPDYVHPCVVEKQPAQPPPVSMVPSTASCALCPGDSAPLPAPMLALLFAVVAEYTLRLFICASYVVKPDADKPVLWRNPY